MVSGVIYIIPFGRPKVMSDHHAIELDTARFRRAWDNACNERDAFSVYRALVRDGWMPDDMRVVRVMERPER